MPNLLQWKCVNGDCRDCGVSKNLKYDECEVLSGKHDVIDVMEWTHAKRAGINKKSGKQNTQLELSKSQLEI